jgi:CBS domain-containing protein
MARYGNDYGRDFGRMSQGQQYGGMRSDGWGGNTDWRNFAGEEGWFGQGYEGMPGNGFGNQGGYGNSGFGGYQRGYGPDFREMGGQSRSGYDRGGYGGGYGQENRGQQLGGMRGNLWNRTRASEIMTADPQAVTPDATLTEVAQKMRDLDVGIIPVVDSADSRKLRGVITDRDIAIRAVAEGLDGTATVADCMTDSVQSVNKNDSVREVMRIMRDEQIRRVPVTDREGRLVGIIAQADLVVDYASDDDSRELEVSSTIERISTPARPSQANSPRMAASDRSGQGGQDELSGGYGGRSPRGQ